LCERINTVLAPKKAGEDQAIGRSKGGPSTKIHVLVDALGNPLKIMLTAGQVHDLAGADTLVPGMEAEALLADKAYDADKRVIEPLEAAGKTAVIPPKKNRKSPRTYDKAWYVARHLIENFFCWAKQFRAIATRYDKTARNFLAAFHMVAALCWLN
jgi:transposase